MSNIQYNLLKVTEEDRAQILVVVDGDALSADSSHPNFQQIVSTVIAAEAGEQVDETALKGLFDPSIAVAEKFERLSERVTVAHGRIYFDGNEVETPLAKQIARFLAEGVEDWKPLVAFFEKVESNPNEHSRKQLFEWLDRYDFTIAPDGDIVAYKGVQVQEDGEGNEVYVSVHSGEAIVDGVTVKGQIPNAPGSVIEMPRDSVQHDPTVGCHRGLHVGTYEYASSFASKLLEVRVNPRDVVSVPTHCSWQKVRCCRYTVVQPIEGKYDEAVLADAEFDVDGSGEDDEMFIVVGIDLCFATDGDE